MDLILGYETNMFSDRNAIHLKKQKRANETQSEYKRGNNVSEWKPMKQKTKTENQ